jgi:chromosome segregation ATPase
MDLVLISLLSFVIAAVATTHFLKKKYHSDLKAQEARLGEITLQNGVLAKQVEALSALNSELRAKVVSVEGELGKAKEELVRVETSLGHMEGQRNQSKLAADEAVSRLAALNDEKQSLEKNLVGLRTQNENFAENAKNASEALIQSKNEYELKLEALRADNQALRGNVTAFEEQEARRESSPCPGPHSDSG